MTVIRRTGSSITVTPTISASSAYASGDQVGGLQTLTNASSGGGSILGLLSKIVVIDKAKQNAAIDIFFFDASPTVISSDNAAADISDAEMVSKAIGVISVAASDYKDLANSSVANPVVAALRDSPMVPSAGTTTIYALAVSRGTPTYGSTSDLVFKYTFTH